MTQYDDRHPQAEAEPSEPGTEVPTSEAEQAADPTEAPTSPEQVVEQAAEEQIADEGAEVQAELRALNDRHLRLAAEFNNFRKRAQTEMGESWTRAQADLVRRLLDPVDDLQRVSALDLSNATVEAIMEGIDLVERKVMRVLEEVGGEEIDPEGAAFDPNTMEAMMRVPADSPEQDDTVAQVFQKGYTLKGHLVRPARVSVRKVD